MPHVQKEIRKIHDEIKADYLFAVKKSIVDFVLKEPEIDEDERFLDEDDETPMTIELAGVSNAWRKLYRQSRLRHREEGGGERELGIEAASKGQAQKRDRVTFSFGRKHLKFNLFTINSCLLQTLSLWFRFYNDLRWACLYPFFPIFENKFNEMCACYLQIHCPEGNEARTQTGNDGVPGAVVLHFKTLDFFFKSNAFFSEKHLLAGHGLPEGGEGEEETEGRVEGANWGHLQELSRERKKKKLSSRGHLVLIF